MGTDPKRGLSRRSLVLTEAQITIQGLDAYAAVAVAFCEFQLGAGCVLAGSDRLWAEAVPDIPIKRLYVEISGNRIFKVDVHVSINRFEAEVSVFDES